MTKQNGEEYTANKSKASEIAWKIVQDMNKSFEKKYGKPALEYYYESEVKSVQGEEQNAQWFVDHCGDQDQPKRRNE